MTNASVHDATAQMGADAVNTLIDLMSDTRFVRRAGPEYVQLVERAICGVCRENESSLYNVIDGIAICGPCRAVARA